MQKEGGYASPAQKDMLANLSAAGYYCTICKSFNEFVKEIKKYFDETAKIPIQD